MITVEVRDQQVIQSVKASVPRSCQDAIWVPIVAPVAPGVIYPPVIHTPLSNEDVSLIDLTLSCRQCLAV
jgi:hypothetical protein